MAAFTYPGFIVVADDDKDDQLLFQDVLDELAVSVRCTFVSNGEQLLQLLAAMPQIPDIIFLDLNMPLKNGADCLTAIRQSKTLQSVPVIIFSTSYDGAVADQLYRKGAHYYICKPNNFEELKYLVQRALVLAAENGAVQPSRGQFVLTF